MKYCISASILSANFARLGEECDAVLLAGADRIHFDVMDNHYVPNLTIGPLVCAALRQYGITAPIDVHLMVKPVDALMKDFADAGASIITFHPEATEHIDRSLRLARDLGCKTGLAFNPATSLEYLHYELNLIDEILIMSVNPGFGGQSFITQSLAKISAAREIIDTADVTHHIALAVDGGIKLDNIEAIADAGADTFIIGSGIFAHGTALSHGTDYRKILQQFKNKLIKLL